MLLERTRIPAEQAIEHLVGMQAQVPRDPYYGLWSRLESFQPDELERLITERAAVRVSLLRTTIHLVTARDCLDLRPVIQPVLERGFWSGSPFGRQIKGIDLEALLAAGRALVDEKPRTTAQLRRELGKRWPEYDTSSLAYAVHYLVPLIQIPPRGLWTKSSQPTFTTVEQWLGQDLAGAAEQSLEGLILRYLRAFGPATAGDIRTWSWLTGVREIVERLRPRLRTFRDERGRELFDVPDAPLPDPDTPAPPRFLPQYDNSLLSHEDRGRIVSEDDRKRTMRLGVGWAALLVDGLVHGLWRVRREPARAVLAIALFHPLSAVDRASLCEEGERLLEFTVPDTLDRDMDIGEAP